MNEYWAAMDGGEIGDELISRVSDYYEFVQSSGLLDTLRKSYRQYYNLDRNGQFCFSDSTKETGQQGELVRMRVNHYRNLIQHLLNITTSQRAAWEPIATNSDYESQSQTILASGLLDYFMREKRLERVFKKAVENALFLFEGWTYLTWDANEGEMYGVSETGVPVYSGDFVFSNPTLLDVIRDFSKESDDHNWTIVRTRVNKHDLAAKYPEYAEKILTIEQDVGRDITVDFADKYYSKAKGVRDEVSLYEFYHKKTDALPEGRYISFLDSDIILIDSPLPYRSIPLYKVTGSDLVGTCFGYSTALDILPVQEGINLLYSTILTNQSAHGVQNIAIPKGSDVSVQQVSSGMNLIEYDSKLGPPSPLNLTQTAPEIFNFLNMLERTVETISGVNQVSRGQVSGQLSGAAMALLHSQSIQFAGGLQAGFTALQEDVGTAIVNILRDYASVPRVAMISGKNNLPLMREFTGEDLSQVNRVTVNTANPLTKTTSGKLEIANNLLQNGMVKTPEQYIQVLTTGQLTPLIESGTSTLLLIRSENEALSEGNNPPTTAIDDHLLHIKEHQSVLANPTARTVPEVVMAVTEHIKSHIEHLRSTDPALLQLLGQQPLGPAPMPSMPQNQGGNVAEVVDARSPMEEEVDGISQPELPEMPQNLMTGETYNPQEGI